jgi:serine/threonine protein kinase
MFCDTEVVFDIAKSNILVDEYGAACLTDFGLSTALQGSGAAVTSTSRSFYGSVMRR